MELMEKRPVFSLENVTHIATTLSDEITFDGLLAKMTELAITSTEAQQVFLILIREGELFIEARRTAESPGHTIQSIPVKGNAWVPETVLQHVVATRSGILLHEVGTDPFFNQDPVIQANQPKSIVCSPIHSHEVLLAIIYLENKLVNNAFSPGQIEWLYHLSEHMGVCIKNALLVKQQIALLLAKETLHKQLQEQKETLQSLIHTQEYERRRIAEDLHDGLGYMLSTLKLNLTTIQELTNQETSLSYISNALLLLDESFKELRSVANHLMPDSLFVHGLVTGVAELCNRITRSGKLQVKFTCFNIYQATGQESDIEVYRIVQELITNTSKHAQAQHLEIQFVYHQEYLAVTAEDDGKGFDYVQALLARPMGSGLQNINNRVKYLNGTLQYDSVIGRGTSVCIQLPLPTQPL
jgi:signal transduction histidine kinase